MWLPKILRRSESFADTAEKVKIPTGGEKSVPDFLGKASGKALINKLLNSTNLVLSDSVRTEATINATIKKLVMQSPDLSMAVESKIKAAIPSRYTVYAVDPMGAIDRKGTEQLLVLLNRWNLGSFDYTMFTRPCDLRSISASLLFNSHRYGAMLMEVVLGKTRLPHYMKSISTAQLEWADNTPYQYPIFTSVSGTKIHLNFPTIHYSASVQDNDTPHADSPLTGAIQACMWDGDFMDALRRAAIKNLMPRLTATITTEGIVALLPEEERTDQKKLTEYMNNIREAIESQLKDLSPEDALVAFDNVTFNTIQDSNRSEDRTMSVLSEIINGKIASGSKILPSIIGRGQSSSAASTESLLFLKLIAHSQSELNNLLSRALTFCLRTLGSKSFAKFSFEEVNLRPDIELATFKAVQYALRQEQLSMGQLSDEEACILSTGHLPPNGYVNKTGTMFKVNYPEVTNDYSNTSVDANAQTDSTQSQKDNGDTAQSGVKSK
ncbi:hypothetical protein KAU11_08390 [Candidatus Babeliales bacterium]|nr:hypothetical protein [Candidatus Babeliales bacterium]